MLVLTRRENQKVLFPHLGISVEVIGMKGQNVRLGIEAPPEIRVLRAELADRIDRSSTDTSNPECQNNQNSRHHFNNRLNSATLQLQLVQKLIENGDVEMASSHLDSALVKLQAFDQAAAPGQRDSHVKLGSGPSNWRALLVEDEPNERELMVGILRMCGFEVDAVADGVQAMEYLHSQQAPTCVLMDMQMPRLTGQETITAIRDQMQFADIPIYGVSGLQHCEANVPIGKRGVAGWFAKPIDTDRMVRQIMADVRGLSQSADSAVNN